MSTITEAKRLKAKSNAKYYASHRDRIILREGELSPRIIKALVECLRDTDLHPADLRIERLVNLHAELTGEEI